jgi:acyl-CoA synthetase (AMP-forming)/AMP-acid ligase II
LGYGGDTAGAFERDSHGWATVGDLALEEYIAVDGEQALRITILGRSDGAILTAGATVIPEEVEAQLDQIDSIAGSVVFGLPNETTGSLVAVLIQRSDFQPAPDLAQLKAQVSLLLSNTHQPRIWFETDQIPRTAAGKIARNVVAELAARKELRRLE